MIQKFPRLVNLSLPKTGSTTIGRVFASVGGVHEGLHDLTVSFILDYLDGLISHQQLLTLLIRRQRQIKATVDSSTFLHLIASELHSFLPQSTLYLQVIRNPTIWVESYLNMLIEVGENLTLSPSIADLAWTSRYGRHHSTILEPVTLYKKYHDNEFMVPVVRDLLLFWQRSVSTVQQAIPDSQLLYFSLDSLGTSLRAIAERIDIPYGKLNLNALSSNVGSRIPGIRDVVSSRISLAIHSSPTVYTASIELYKRLVDKPIQPRF